MALISGYKGVAFILGKTTKAVLFRVKVINLLILQKKLRIVIIEKLIVFALCYTSTFQRQRIYIRAGAESFFFVQLELFLQQGHKVLYN